jgi:cell division protein FtsX
MDEETKQEGSPQPIEDGRALNKMTAIELREIAKDIPGVEGVHAMKKEELLAIIKKHRGIKDRAKKAAKSPQTVKQLKGKVSLLKDEKAVAREARERKKVEILRRRINRTKKRTRKVAEA